MENIFFIKGGGNRLSNIELLRFLSMILVLALHCNFLSLGEVDLYDFEEQPSVSIFRIFLQAICLICVNVFVLISGWFGIKRTSVGFKRLLFQILFVSFVAFLIACLFNWRIAGFQDFSGYWFIVAYLGLYILSPLLNTYLEAASNIDLLVTIIGYGVIMFFCGWIYDVASFHRGFSFAHFIWLYLLAGSLRRGVVLSRFQIVHWIILFCCFVVANVILYFIAIGLSSEFVHFRWSQYINPLVIGASVSFFMIFTKIRIHQNWVFNWLGSSAFTIYLLHTNGFIWHHFLGFASSIFENNNGYLCLIYMLLYMLCVVVVSILIDFFYKYAYSFLH